jgi:transmembrane sensor
MLLVGSAGLGAYLDVDSPTEYARGLTADSPDSNFSDGSHGYLIGDGASMSEVASAGPDVVIRLDSGGALFSVVRDESRTFRVEAGRATVEVLGTTFRVVHSGPDTVDITVYSGRVRVSYDGVQIDELTRGQTLSLNPDIGATAAPSPAEPEVENAQPANTEVSNRPRRMAIAPVAEIPSAAETPEAEEPPAPTVTSWRDLAREGQYDEAHTVLQASGGGTVGNRPADLMLAADAARLSGHPGEALRYLQRVVQEHPTDPRAALAAFTLGRVLLYQLGRATEAARAFRQCRALRRGGPMSEDALAREVEAWSRAGNTSEAQRLANDYLRIYPEGRRRDIVRRHAGLE